MTLWVTVQAIVIQPLLYPTAGYIGLRLRGLFEELAAEQGGVAQLNAPPQQQKSAPG